MYSLNVSLNLSPLPQLFPRLDELLNLPGRREMVAGDPATEITTLIKIAHRAAREMREPMTQVFQVLPAQNFFRDLRTPRHDEGILAYSLFVRLCFIVRKMRILQRGREKRKRKSGRHPFSPVIPTPSSLVIPNGRLARRNLLLLIATALS
jgi:hypothetical protein